MSRSRPYHHGDLKRAILDAAAELVESDGPKALTFRRLADKVGVSHAAPLAHFPDRAALDQAVAARACRRLGEELAEAGGGVGAVAFQASPTAVFSNPATAFAAPPAPQYYERLAPVPPERKLFSRRLLRLAGTWLRFALERPGLFRLLRETETDTGGELAAEKARLSALVEDLVALGQRAGEFRRGIPPARMARLVIATVEGLASRMEENEPAGDTDRLKEAEQVLELLLRGIAS